MKSVDGMWEFPMYPELPSGSFKKIGECHHTITHHRLDVSVVEGRLSPEQFAWKQIDAIPISSLTRKIWKVKSAQK